MRRAEVEILAKLLLSGSSLSSFSISSRLGIARMAATDKSLVCQPQNKRNINILSIAAAAAPVALEKMDEAAETTDETAWGAGAGFAFTAAAKATRSVV